MPREGLSDRVAALRERRAAAHRVRVRRTVLRRDGVRCEVAGEDGARLVTERRERPRPELLEVLEPGDRLGDALEQLALFAQ